MSRAKIGAVVAVIVAVLTGTAYLLATEKLEDNIQKDAEARAGRAKDLLIGVASLEAFDIISRARSFAREDSLQKALDAEPPQRGQLARAAIDKFVGGFGDKENKPDWVAILDAQGNLVWANYPSADTEGWKARFKSVAD